VLIKINFHRYLWRLEKPGRLFDGDITDATHHIFSTQVKLVLSPKQRAKQITTKSL
jgi:hypothetical protein